MTARTVLAVEPRARHCAQEELRAIGICPRICHAQDARPVVLQLEVLVGKHGAVNALATSAVTCREIAALAHELGDDAVEGRALELQGLASGSQALLAYRGILRCLWLESLRGPCGAMPHCKHV